MSHLGYYYVIQRQDDSIMTGKWADIFYKKIWGEKEAQDEFKTFWMRNRDITYRLLKCFDSDSDTRHIKEIMQVVPAKNP